MLGLLNEGLEALTALLFGKAARCDPFSKGLTLSVLGLIIYLATVELPKLF